MKRLFLLINILSLFLVGCNDLLDIEDKDLVREDKNFTDQEELTANYVSILGEMQGIADDLVVLNDLRSNQLTVTEYADNSLKAIEQLKYSKSNPYCDKTKYYSIINSCNGVIYNAKRLLRDSELADEKVLLAHYADALKLRTYVYFNIAKIFGSIEHYTVPISTLEEANDDQLKTKLTFDEAITQLIADLTSVDEDLRIAMDWFDKLELPKNLNFTTFKYDYLLGDLYLWAGDYQMAADHFYKFMNSDALYVLPKDIYSGEKFASIFTGGINTSGENITWIDYVEKYEQIFEFDELFTGSAMLQPTGDIVNDYDKEAPILVINKGDEFRADASYLKLDDRYMVTKYAQRRFVFYRCSEAHLKFCEAKAMLGELDLAYILLNSGVNPDKGNVYYDEGTGNFLEPFDSSWITEFSDNHGVRGRVKLENKEYPSFDAASPEEEAELKKQVLLQWIFDEYNLELSFEGKRYETALRYAMRENDFQKYAEKLSTADKDYTSKLSAKDMWFIK